jgi:arginyl-tRNA synthetase
LLEALGAAISAVSPAATLEPAFESPRQAGLGDLASTAALQLAKGLKQAPREVASRLIDALQVEPAVRRWVESIDIAGPGFINLRLKPAARQSVVTEILEAAPPMVTTADIRVGSSSSSSRPTRPARCTSAMAARRRSAIRSATCWRRRAGR